MKFLVASLLLAVASAATLPYSSSTTSPVDNSYPLTGSPVPIVANQAYAGIPNTANAPLMPYNFNWVVKDDPSTNNFNHVENSDGKIVRGEYRVQLPDGRMQTVKYSVDSQTGYVAEVVYDGTAVYPEEKQQYQSPAAVGYHNKPAQAVPVVQTPTINSYNTQPSYSSTASAVAVQQQLSYNGVTTPTPAKRY